jgi:hypothetical protein
MMGEHEDRRDDEERDRHHRELVELLNELRVALPGVQVLFAFLLTVPFTNRFDALTTVQTRVFMGAFLATGIASILLMGPSAYHRIRFRDGDEERMLRTSNRWALSGLVFLALALVLVVYLVAELVTSTTFAVLASIVFAVLAASMWFALPLSRRRGPGP